VTNEPPSVYEMLWDCPYCGTKKLLGKTHRHCPECGAPQDAEKRYFPSDDEKVAVKDHVYVGVDRLCASCGGASSARAKHCTGCGAALDDPGSGSREIGRRKSEQVAEEQRFAAGSAQDIDAKAKADAELYAGMLGSRSRTGLYVFLGVAAAAVVGIVLAVLFSRKDVSVQATGHSWLREIAIESFEARSDSSWCDELPAGAYRVSRTREVRSQREVPDGQTCNRRRIDNGDGTFREERECTPRYRKEPIYDDRCHYQVDSWGPSRTLTAKGEGLGQPPAWPDTSGLRRGSCLGCEREAGRTATYTLHLRDLSDGKTYSCDFPERVWTAVPVGTSFKTRAGRILRRLDCEKLLSSQ